METKERTIICVKCGLPKFVDDFHKKGDGIRSVCKECRKTERKNRYINNKEVELENSRLYSQNNREKRLRSAREFAARNLSEFRLFLNNIKNVPCMDCGNNFPPCAMDFDHREPENKLFNISEAQSMNRDVLIQEIDKCDIICANCHRIREHNRNHTKVSCWNKIVYAYKNRSCSDCGTNYPPHVMDFDHKNPEEKLFHISKPGAHNKAEIIAEIMKCDVVCANCHRMRTFLKQEGV